MVYGLQRVNSLNLLIISAGASLDYLFMSSNAYQDGIQVELFNQPKYESPVMSPEQTGYGIDNLLLVLEVLGYSMKNNK